MAVASRLHQRCEVLSDIPEKLDFFDRLPEYDTALYIHKKSKTDEAVSLEMLNAALPVLSELSEWTTDSIHDALISLAEKLEVKNAKLMWPVRIAVAGKAVTPGGAVEICYILGRKETLTRIEKGIQMLTK